MSSTDLGRELVILDELQFESSLEIRNSLIKVFYVSSDSYRITILKGNLAKQVVGIGKALPGL